MRQRLARHLSALSSRLQSTIDEARDEAEEGCAAVDIDSLRLTHKEIRERVARLDTNTSRLDVKATSLLGFISAISLFLATQKTNGWWKAPAFAALLGAAFYGFQALRIRQFLDSPDPRSLVETTAGRQEAAVLVLLTAAQILVYEENKQKHKTKTKNWHISLGLLVAAIVATIAALTLGGVNGKINQQQPPGQGKGQPATTNG